MFRTPNSSVLLANTERFGSKSSAAARCIIDFRVDYLLSICWLTWRLNISFFKSGTCYSKSNNFSRTETRTVCWTIIESLLMKITNALSDLLIFSSRDQIDCALENIFWSLQYFFDADSHFCFSNFPYPAVVIKMASSANVDYQCNYSDDFFYTTPQSHCAAYYRCHNNQKIKHDCPYGMLFDFYKQKCVTSSSE